MDKEKLLSRIEINPEVMVGKPTIRGLRITVEHVLQSLSAGLNASELLEEYPELESDDIRAALLYAAERVNEEQVYKISV